jgi:hypothetical protein
MNSSRLSQELTRADFLRLKFDKLDEAERQLRMASVSYVPSALIRKERLYASLHPSVLDEKGRPIEYIRAKAYDNAFGEFISGNIAQAEVILKKYLDHALESQDPLRIELITDFSADGEMEYLNGSEQLGAIMLNLLVKIDNSDDLIEPLITAAKNLLKLGAA